MASSDRQMLCWMHGSGNFLETNQILLYVANDAPSCHPMIRRVKVLGVANNKEQPWRSRFIEIERCRFQRCSFQVAWTCMMYRYKTSRWPSISAQKKELGRGRCGPRVTSRVYDRPLPRDPPIRYANRNHRAISVQSEICTYNIQHTYVHTPYIPANVILTAWIPQQQDS